jgi:hypothetical protein
MALRLTTTEPPLEPDRIDLVTGRSEGQPVTLHLEQTLFLPSTSTNRLFVYVSVQLPGQTGRKH